MERMNADDPLEKRLREIALEKEPSGVYGRLQARAVWNRPAANPLPIIFLVLATLIGATVGLSMFSQWFFSPSSTTETLKPEAPFASPSSVIALNPQASSLRLCDDDPYQIGGLSSRMLREPAFAVPFGDPMTPDSIYEDLVDS